MENENLEEKIEVEKNNVVEEAQVKEEKVEVMEEIIEETTEVADSGIIQLKYFFSSWTKYFTSIAVKPKFLVFLGLMFVLVLAMTPFREAQKEITIESTRVTLEETFSNNALYQDFSDDELEALVEQTLRATENMYSAPIFLLTNVLVTAFGLLMTFVLLYIVLKLLKSDITPKQMLGVAVGATVITTIQNLVYAVTLNFTGSLTNIMSLGIFAIDAPVSSTQFVLLNSITIASVITFVFYYFMGTNLLRFSKNKSLTVSFLLIIIPILLTVVPTMLVNMLM